MQDEDAPRHHRLRGRDRCGRIGCRCRTRARDERHAQPDEQHEEERDARRDAPFGRGVDVVVAHQHAHDKGREQHLDVDAVLGAVPVFRGEVDRLCQRTDDDREPQDPLPVLTHVPGGLPAPADGQQHGDDRHDGEHLPAQPDHEDLQRDHQQDGVQVVEDGQHLDLAVDPALLELQCGEHREEDAGRGGGREPAQQQVLLPRLGAVPQRRGQQHEDIIEYDEQPRECRRGHGDEVVGRVASPAALVDLEFTADVDHDEAQTDVQQRVGRGLERGVSRAEKLREQLGRDESQHQEKGKREYFSHRSCRLFARCGNGPRGKDTTFAQIPKRGPQPPVRGA